MTIEEQKAAARTIEQVVKILQRKRISEIEKTYLIELLDRALVYLQQQEHEL